jgi:predicted enzyme related to lactoylglutathione lyase
MLADSTVHPNVPASDLDRARAFYAEKLGLTPSSEEEGMLLYKMGGGSSFTIYQTAYAGTAGHTLMQWEVADIEDEVSALRSKGVAFEEYDMPGVEWKGGIASAPMGRAAWFKDSEGNIMCLDQRA